MRILAVDDDDLALEALRTILVEAGHDVVTVDNAARALDILQTGECRLVISDWLMPGMDGLELCRRIRQEEFGGYVYVILLTSRGNADDIVRGLSAGADDFVTKPFHPAELCIRVRAGERILGLETRDVAIFAMAKLAESRDPETGAHLERICGYARVLADWLVATGHVRDEGFPRLIYLTSPLHDIGKVGIPDSILLKPDRLNDREFEVMKRHTTIGADTLDAAVRRYPGVAYLQLAREIALTHHERFDGTGYPAGIAGEEIPLSGRIVALADVYDALTSRRVYKPASSHDLARDVIVLESGKHFDPILVKAFKESESQFDAIRNRLATPEPAELPCG